MWVCIGDWKNNRAGNCHVDIWTLAYTRKQSMEELLDRLKGHYDTWQECYKNGWRCVKVKTLISQQH